MNELVDYHLEGRAAILTLKRADKRNALSRALIATLTHAFQRAAADNSARAVILTGEGPAFCAGMDLEELQGTLTADESIIWEDALRLSQLLDLIYTLDKPTIAAINGSAVAGGAGLVSVCDLAVSVPTAKFGYPEVRRGLVAAMVLPHLLRHVGERAANFLLLSGDLISAEEAQRIGFINAVVNPNDLLPKAMEWAKSCAAGGPKSIARTKELLRQLSTRAFSVEEAAKASAAPRLEAECRGGLQAFFAKKPAPWE
jgi:methylglutaconyl-CoA hydratase